MNHITVKHIIFINFETFSRSCQCHETVGAAGYHTENANYYIHIFAKFHFWFLESQASVRASVQRYIATSECRSSTLIISRTNYLFSPPLYASTFPFCPFFALTFGRNHFFFIIFKKYIEEKGTSTLEFPYSLPVNWRYYYYYYLSIFKKNNIKKSTHVGQICNMKFCSYYNINFPYAPSSFLYVFLCINFFQCKYGSSLKK